MLVFKSSNGKSVETLHRTFWSSLINFGAWRNLSSQEASSSVMRCTPLLHYVGQHFYVQVCIFLLWVFSSWKKIVFSNATFILRSYFRVSLKRSTYSNMFDLTTTVKDITFGKSNKFMTISISCAACTTWRRRGSAFFTTLLIFASNPLNWKSVHVNLMVDVVQWTFQFYSVSRHGFESNSAKLEKRKIGKCNLCIRLNEQI